MSGCVTGLGGAAEYKMTRMAFMVTNGIGDLLDLIPVSKGVVVVVVFGGWCGAAGGVRCGVVRYGVCVLHT